jgi:hypothetical protein
MAYVGEPLQSTHGISKISNIEPASEIQEHCPHFRLDSPAIFKTWDFVGGPHASEIPTHFGLIIKVSIGKRDDVVDQLVLGWEVAL